MTTAPKPSVAGNAEDEKFPHKEMLVEKSMFGIHRAGGFGLIYSNLLVPTSPPPTASKLVPSAG